MVNLNEIANDPGQVNPIYEGWVHGGGDEPQGSLIKQSEIALIPLSEESTVGKIIALGRTPAELAPYFTFTTANEMSKHGFKFGDETRNLSFAANLQIAYQQVSVGIRGAGRGEMLSAIVASMGTIMRRATGRNRTYDGEITDDA